MPSPAVQYDDTLEQGADWELVLLDRDQDGEDGDPTDLTGCTALFRVWEDGNPPVLRLSLTSASGGGITINGSDGEIIIRMTAAQTATVRRDARYSLRLTWPDGEVNWLIRGRLSVIPEVPSV